MNNKIGLIMVLMVLVSLNFTVVSGDRGAVTLNPLIQIEENTQNAIIAWNGTEEVLILSTDITSSESTPVLELLPLPSNPLEVKEGSFESFTKLQEIANEKLKYYYGVAKRYSPSKARANISEGRIEITFQSNIGVHNITIVKVNNFTYFVEWTNNFAKQKGFENINFSTNFQNCIKDYLNRGIKFFVFDFIEINETKQSVNPIIYRFNTNYLYYPMNITAFSDAGETFTTSVIRLLLLTEGMIKEDVISKIFPDPLSSLGVKINLKKEELKEISSDVYNLFKGDLFLTVITYNGFLSNLKVDLTASQEDFTYPNLELDFEKEILIERGKSKIVNVALKNISDAKHSYIELSIEGDIQGVQHDWFSIKPSSYYFLEEGNETTFEVLFTIPINVSPGRYNLSYIASLYPVSGYHLLYGYGLKKIENATLIVYDVYGAASEFREEIGELKSEIGFLSSIIIFGMILVVSISVVITIMAIISIKIKK